MYVELVPAVKFADPSYQDKQKIMLHQDTGYCKIVLYFLRVLTYLFEIDIVSNFKESRSQ